MRCVITLLHVSRTNPFDKTFVSDKAVAASAGHVSKPFGPKGEPRIVNEARFRRFMRVSVGGRQNRAKMLSKFVAITEGSL